jgi:hypothetical protein
LWGLGLALAFAALATGMDRTAWMRWKDSDSAR